MTSEEKKQKTAEYGKKWWAANADRVKALKRQYYADHREERREANRKWYRDNRASVLAATKQRRLANPDAVLGRYLKREYGVDLVWYRTQLEKQGNSCGICRSVKPGGKGRWHVDHDHTTEQARGLLCLRCNVLLGAARDQPEILLAAVDWLKER
ncbi:MAG: endonuclease domain-containing protein [Gemmatimonadales bacterium]